MIIVVFAAARAFFNFSCSCISVPSMRVEYEKYRQNEITHESENTQRLSLKKFRGGVLSVDEIMRVRILFFGLLVQKSRSTINFLPAPVKNVLFGNQRTPVRFSVIFISCVEGNSNHAGIPYE